MDEQGIHPMNITTFFENFYARERDLSPQSTRQLRMSLGFFTRLHGDIELDSLSHRHLNDWAILKRDDWASKTLKRRVADVLAIWNYAYEIEFTNNKPDTRRVRSVRVAKRVPDAWTLEELERMIASALTFRALLPNGVARGDVLVAAVCSGFYSGLRASDLFRLTRDQLIESGTAVQQAKRRGDEVLVRIPDWFTKWLDQAYPSKVVEVVAWPHGREYFYDAWDKMLKHAGMKTGPREKLQKIRRTTVTYGEAEQLGFGAQLAGHAPGTRTTYESYADPRIIMAASERIRSLPRLKLA